MELLFVLLIGVGIGLIVRMSIPGRDRSGIALVPAVSASVACLGWVALTWLGLSWDAGLIWWITVIVATAAAIASALWLARSRAAHDEDRFRELAGA